MPPQRNRQVPTDPGAMGFGSYGAPIWDERRRSLADFGGLLERIGRYLREQGAFTVKGVSITPPDPCVCKVKYERMPHGALSVKLELEWEPDAQLPTVLSGEDLEIGPPT